jgi:ketosteroid isomerase-like protein
VRFEFSEIVEHPDPNLVLHILEYCFRDVSLEAIHNGDQLTIYGLGPSFRTMNRSDKTVLRATRQQTATIVHAEANFLASALMGDMPQDTVVRSKIEQAFRCMKSQLNLDVIPLPPDSPSLHSSDSPRPLRTERFAPRMPDTPDPHPDQSPVLEHTSFQADMPTTTIEPLIQSPAMEPSEPIAFEPKAPVAAISPASAASPPPPTPVLDSEALEPVLSEPFLPIKASPAEHKRSPVFPLTLLAVLFLLCGAYFLQHRNFAGNLFSLTGAKQIAAPTVDRPTATQASPAPVHETAEQPYPTPAQSSLPATTTAGPEDIKAWVKDWATAMSTRDAGAQVSFYADPVDRYFLTPNVSKKELLREKQSDIASRNGLWTLKAEDVVIQQQTKSNAVVYFTKHFMVKSPTSSSIREQRLKTQLKLKLVDGNWKITSERTIGWG